MAGKVDHSTRKFRSAELRQLSGQKKAAYYREQLGQTMRVLFEERDKHKRWTGFTDNYVKVAVTSDEHLENEIRDVYLENTDSSNIVEGVLNER